MYAITFRVRHIRGEMYDTQYTDVCWPVATAVCVSVCLSLAAFPHYCTNADVTWGNGRGCPVVVQCSADLQKNLCMGFVAMTTHPYVSL